MGDAPMLGGHHAGPSSGVTGPVMDNSSDVRCPSNDVFGCEFPGCDRYFSTKIGRGVHHRRGHADWYDAQQDLEHKKARWNAEESALMAREEARLVQQGVKFLNQELVKVFPNRTLEAIKGQRRKPQYKADVKLALRSQIAETVEATQQRNASISLGSQSAPGSDSSCDHDPSPEEIKANMIEFIDSLPPCKTSSFNNERLNLICHSLNRWNNAQIFEEISLYLLQTFPIRKSERIRHKASQVPKSISRRQARRAEYFKVQRAWKKNRTTCIRSLLKDKHACSPPPQDVMVPFWENIMTSNVTTSPSIESKREVEGNLWIPILSKEIIKALPSYGTAPGPDGLTAENLREIPLGMLTRILNIFMLCGKLPAYLLESRTTLIPKKDGASDPSEFRPITVSSTLARTFHKVLANRMARLIGLDWRQKAFRPIDGCSENIFLLDFALRYSRQSFKPLFLASLDVAKAFDSVTHRSIMDTLHSVGVPKLMIDYISGTYERSFTRLHYDKWESHVIHPSCGVKQGDPLSPIIFNLVIDNLLSKLPQEVGLRFGDSVLNAACFADDLVLFATTSQGLQLMLDITADYLNQCGLKVNASKCCTVAVKNVAKEKKSVIDAKRVFNCSGYPLPALKRSDDWRYLGVPFSPEGRLMCCPLGKLKEHLDTLSAAPLKPQQRLFILRTVVLPSFQHLLVLGSTNISLLRKLDIVVRSYTRKWLTLPHDVPNAYFHADAKDGGLSLSSFRWTIPLYRLHRLRKLIVIKDGVIPETIKQFIDREMKRVEQRLNDQGHMIRSLEEYKKRFARLLYESNDGRPLKGSRGVATQHQWITDGTLFVSGRDFVHMNKLRINAIPLRTRMARGQVRDTHCRAGCGHAETLQHVLQHCERTSHARIKRHNACLEYMLKGVDQDTSIFREPHFRTTEGLRKPDVIIKQDQSAIVVDALIAGERANLNQAHRAKIDKYQGLAEQVKKKYSVRDVVFTSLTLSSRGVWSTESFEHLRSLRLLKKSDAKFLSTRALIGGLSILTTFNKSTRTNHHRRVREGIG